MLKQIEKVKYNIMRLKHHLKSSYKLAEDETKFWEAYPRLISPAELYELKTHCIIDGETYIETIIAGIPGGSNLRGYPKGLNRHIMNDLTDLNMEGCRVSICFSLVPIPVTETAGLLDDTIMTNRQNQITAAKQTTFEGVETVPLDLVFDYEDHKDNYKRFHDRKHNVFHSMLIIVLAARSIEALRSTKSMVKQKLKGKLVLAETPQWRQKETFLLAQAFPGWKEYASVELFSETASVLAPLRTPNSKMDSEGMYYGIDLKTKKRVVVDEYKLSSRSKLIIGATGAGKTFLLMLILMRAHDLLGKRVIVTSNKPDVTTDIGAVVNFYKEQGQIVSIGPQGNNLNPLQILYDEQELNNNSYEYVLAFNAHKGLVQKFFNVFLTTTPPQRSLLDHYLNEVYQQKGIYRNDPSSWKNADWPVIADDLRPLFKRDMEKDISAAALYHNTFQFDHDGELGYMNRKTDVDLSKSFIYLDMSAVPEVVKDALNVLATGILSIRFRTDAKMKTVIAMDEAGGIIRNPEIAAFLLKLISQARSFGIEGIFCTQQTTDLVQAGVSEQMKTNVPINIILGENMTPASIDIVKNYFQLSKDEVQQLLKATVGKGILKVQNLSWAVNFQASPQELDVIKGNYAKPSLRPSGHDGITVKKAVASIAEQHKVLFDSWIQESHNGDLAEVMKDRGFVKKTVQNAFENGLTGMWIEKEIISSDGKIYNQSLDHYSTVAQIHAFLAENGIQAESSNINGPDVVAHIRGKTLAIEFERPGTHTAAQIFEKHHAAQQSYDRCVIVATYQNQKIIKNAIGSNDMILRGGKLKAFLDEYIQAKIERI